MGRPTEAFFFILVTASCHPYRCSNLVHPCSSLGYGDTWPSRRLAIHGVALTSNILVRVMACGPFSPSMATGTLGRPWPAVPSRRPWLQGHLAVHGLRSPLAILGYGDTWPSLACASRRA
ncbi:hypothetical protein [Desulfosporosinus sp. I2]|uniref:hypothetical protein n=1 Tax=Desulfosporosinus sp. I2 TaxID=1617025 RepID=UPI0012DFF8EC|nr:hypothetical protein [Desulfosporosinus sp. I2]